MPFVRSILLSVVIAVAMFPVACEQKPKNPVSEYGDALMGARKRAQKGAEAANLDAVKRSIDAYRAANDKYPADLKDIEDLLGSPVDPAKYDYNPQTGSVALRTQN